MVRKSHQFKTSLSKALGGGNELRDTKRAKAIAKHVTEGLESIVKCDLPGKLKLWYLQYGLTPKIRWPLTVVYDIAITHVETMERQLMHMQMIWLRVPNSMTNTARQSSQTKLTADTTSTMQ